MIAYWREWFPIDLLELESIAFVNCRIMQEENDSLTKSMISLVCIDALQRFFYISKTYMAPSLLYL